MLHLSSVLLVVNFMTSGHTQPVNSKGYLMLYLHSTKALEEFSISDWSIDQVCLSNCWAGTCVHTQDLYNQLELPTFCFQRYSSREVLLFFSQFESWEIQLTCSIKHLCKVSYIGYYKNP
jgi:hypothetical protein